MLQSFSIIELNPWLNFCKDESVNAPISMGISLFEEDDENTKDVFNRMDQTLYQVKKNSKDSNKVIY